MARKAEAETKTKQLELEAKKIEYETKKMEIENENALRQQQTVHYPPAKRQRFVIVPINDEYLFLVPLIGRRQDRLHHWAYTRLRWDQYEGL